MICCDSGASAAFQSKPRMGNTLSMSHPGLFHVKTTSATLLTTNLVVLIEVGRGIEKMGRIGTIATTKTTEKLEYQKIIPILPAVFVVATVSLCALHLSHLSHSSHLSHKINLVRSTPYFSPLPFYLNKTRLPIGVALLLFTPQRVC